MANAIRQRALNNRMAIIVSRPVRLLSDYKEVAYGAGMGVSMWVVDATMHAIQRGPISWSGFVQEMIASNDAQLLFRLLFVAMATALGISLWRSNRHRCQVRDLQALLGAFHRQVVNPVVLIVGYSRMLSLREGWPVGREAVEIIHEIQLNAQKVNNAIKHLPPPFETVATASVSDTETARARAAPERSA